MKTARPMILKNRAIDEERSRRILREGTYGVLATSGIDAAPYAVPLTYVLDGDNIYFHGASVGQKIENIARNPRICFCVVGKARVNVDMFDLDYESVLVYGRAKVIVGEEKRAAMAAYLRKYAGSNLDKALVKMEHDLDRVFVVRIAIEEITGKANDTQSPKAHY